MSVATVLFQIFRLVNFFLFFIGDTITDIPHSPFPAPYPHFAHLTSVNLFYSVFLPQVSSFWTVGLSALGYQIWSADMGWASLQSQTLFLFFIFLVTVLPSLITHFLSVHQENLMVRVEAVILKGYKIHTC